MRHPSAAGLVAGGVLGAGLLTAAWRVTRTCLVVDPHGLADHRLLRMVQVSWADIASFEVARPANPDEAS